MKRSHRLLMLMGGLLFTTAVAGADRDVSDLQRRALEADLEAQAALEFSARFQKMADEAADEILFLPANTRESAFEQADRLRNAAAGARATYHRLLDLANELHAAVAESRPQSRPSDYDYRIIDAITSEVLTSALIVELPTPELDSSVPVPLVEITTEPNEELASSFESGPVPAAPEDDAQINTIMTVGSMPIVKDQSMDTDNDPYPDDALANSDSTVGSIGPVPNGGNRLEDAAKEARTLANRALNFAVEMQVAAEQAIDNYTRFKNFRGKVDAEQYEELQKKAELLTEEAELAEFEYQQLDSRAADLEAEVKAASL